MSDRDAAGLSPLDRALRTPHQYAGGHPAFHDPGGGCAALLLARAGPAALSAAGAGAMQSCGRGCGECGATRAALLALLAAREEARRGDLARRAVAFCVACKLARGHAPVRLAAGEAFSPEALFYAVVVGAPPGVGGRVLAFVGARGGRSGATFPRRGGGAEGLRRLVEEQGRVIEFQRRRIEELEGGGGMEDVGGIVAMLKKRKHHL
ncbi:hypothetical protein TeGR_g15123 [Tetraparma gracilis]|uniref:Uncharacterized protein n=1 Tax=Tetraparma gracilis TaxID=2962635 RepID=A0ABQ6NBG2_9STRA|nr:hypothetical protein TeGR_g15123 [Tetraparma gracilis]